MRRLAEIEAAGTAAERGAGGAAAGAPDRSIGAAAVHARHHRRRRARARAVAQGPRRRDAVRATGGRATRRGAGGEHTGGTVGGAAVANPGAGARSAARCPRRRHGRARALGGGRGARFALARASSVATDAIRAMSRRAFGILHARRSRVTADTDAAAAAYGGGAAAAATAGGERHAASVAQLHRARASRATASTAARRGDPARPRHAACPGAAAATAHPGDSRRRAACPPRGGSAASCGCVRTSRSAASDRRRSSRAWLSARSGERSSAA